jgi:predicted AAA+ superfamily ATPase
VLSLYGRWLEERLGEPPPAEWFASHTAFRWERNGSRGRLQPVTPGSFDLDDLVGVERPLAELLRNTEQFLRGLPAQQLSANAAPGSRRRCAGS